MRERSCREKRPLPDSGLRLELLPRTSPAWQDKLPQMALQVSIRIAERNDALDRSSQIKNANLARAKACAARSVVNGLQLIQEKRLDAGRFKALPAVSEWPDFDDHK